MKKLICTLASLFLCAVTVFSQDYEELAKSGTASQIKKAVRSDERISYKVFGSDGENLLMLVLKNNRDLDIVNLCLSTEIDVTSKNKHGTTSVMYACRYATNPKVVTTVVKSGTIFGIGTASRLAKKDSFGKNSYDYAKENPNKDIYKVINEIEKDPALKNAPKDEPKEKTEPAEAEKNEKAVTAAEEPKEEKNLQKQEPKAPEAAHKNSPSPEKKALPVQEPVQLTKPIISIEDISGKVSDQIKKETGTEQEEKHPENTVFTVPPVSVTAEVPPAQEKTEKNEKPAVPEAETKNPGFTTYTRTYLYDYAIKSEIVDEGEKAEPSRIENPDLADKNGVTLLMKAAKAGNDWDVQNLLASGANVNLRDKDGWTALMYACRYQNSLSLVNALIEAGAYIRVRNKYNSTPLLMAADYSQNPKIIERLLKDRNAGEDEVFRAFILCVTSNQGEYHVREAKINLFINLGIPINRLWKGKTPLMYACQYTSSTEALKFLMDNGAKPGIQDASGKTAFDYAKLNSNLKRDDIFWSLNSSER